MRKRVWTDRLRCHLTLEASRDVERRLRNDHFRGRDLRRAGNVCRWEHLDAAFEDAQFRVLLIEAVANQLRGVALTGRARELRVTVRYPRPIGWAGTAPYEKALADTYDDYRPNDRTVALRVRRGAAQRAPGTNLLTVVLGVSRRDGIHANVLTAYPGPDIGPLRPSAGEADPVDITKREGIVFFDWNHEGEPLAS